jgi:hypothetical protein
VPQPELLALVVDVLERAGIPYMVTGSIASSLFGQPRATHDIDLIVAIAPEKVSVLINAFLPPDFYLSLESIQDAIRNHTMFNLLDVSGGDKVDFWILTNEPFDQSRFARRSQHTIAAKPVLVASAEDTILAKLRWAELSGGSEKQFQDALRVFEVQRKGLDMDYLNHWAGELGVEPLWGRLQAEAETV